MYTNTITFKRNNKTNQINTNAVNTNYAIVIRIIRVHSFHTQTTQDNNVMQKYRKYFTDKRIPVIRSWHLRDQELTDKNELQDSKSHFS